MNVVNFSTENITCHRVIFYHGMWCNIHSQRTNNLVCGLCMLPLSIVYLGLSIRPEGRFLLSL